MPNYDNNNLFGTLYITFDIDFPKQEFSDEEKEGNIILLNFLKIYFCLFNYMDDLVQLGNNTIIGNTYKVFKKQNNYSLHKT